MVACQAALFDNDAKECYSLNHVQTRKFIYPLAQKECYSLNHVQTQKFIYPSNI